MAARMSVRLSTDPKQLAIQEESLKRSAEYVEAEIWKILIEGSRMSDKKYRSSVTGEYVTEEFALANADITVAETEAVGIKTFDEYQGFVASMKIYPEKFAIIYPALGLAGEAGEIAEKVKKWIRDQPGKLITDEGVIFIETDRREAILKELGDPLWYITSMAADLGYTLQDVVDANYEKLTSRKERGLIKGSGDDR